MDHLAVLEKDLGFGTNDHQSFSLAVPTSSLVSLDKCTLETLFDGSYVLKLDAVMDKRRDIEDLKRMHEKHRKYFKLLQAQS
jgi:hypothetical protein